MDTITPGSHTELFFKHETLMQESKEERATFYHQGGILLLNILHKNYCRSLFPITFYARIFTKVNKYQN